MECLIYSILSIAISLIFIYFYCTHVTIVLLPQEARYKPSGTGARLLLPVFL